MIESGKVVSIGLSPLKQRLNGIVFLIIIIEVHLDTSRTEHREHISHGIIGLGLGISVWQVKHRMPC